MIKTKRLISNSYFLCVAILPVLCIFWQDMIPFTFFKVNWIFYPILIFFVFATSYIRKQAPVSLLAVMAFTLFYTMLVALKQGEMEGLFRFVITILPFCFLYYFYDENPRQNFTWFWVIYGISVSVPLFNSYLQYIGVLPYYEFDIRDGQYMGRISGGYNKPMNLIAFLVPLYLAGFYLAFVAGKKKTGYVIIFAVCAFLVLIGHRTSLIAFLVMLASAAFMTKTIQIITFYYKYFLNFFISIFAFIFFYFLQYYFGILEGVRGRIAMWSAHAEEFFNGSLSEILIGHEKIQLSDHYKSNIKVASMVEAHNNSFRTIIFFGIFGFFLYCVFMRWMALRVARSTDNKQLLFLRLSCFTYFILYTITNEPFYYSSILWPVFIWIFPIHSLIRTRDLKLT